MIFPSSLDNTVQSMSSLCELKSVYLSFFLLFILPPGPLRTWKQDYFLSAFLHVFIKQMPHRYSLLDINLHIAPYVLSGTSPLSWSFHKAMKINTKFQITEQLIPRNSVEQNVLSKTSLIRVVISQVIKIQNIQSYFTEKQA